MPHRKTLLTEGAFDVFPDGVALWRAGRRADDEEIGNVGERAQIHHDHVLGLLVQSGPGREERFGLAIHPAGRTDAQKLAGFLPTLTCPKFGTCRSRR